MLHIRAGHHLFTFFLLFTTVSGTYVNSIL
jgi:hypothetical protein